MVTTWPHKVNKHGQKWLKYMAPNMFFVEVGVFDYPRQSLAILGQGLTLFFNWLHFICLPCVRHGLTLFDHGWSCWDHFRPCFGPWFNHVWPCLLTVWGHVVTMFWPFADHGWSFSCHVSAMFDHAFGLVGHCLVMVCLSLAIFGHA